MRLSKLYRSPIHGFVTTPDRSVVLYHCVLNVEETEIFRNTNPKLAYSMMEKRLFRRFLLLRSQITDDLRIISYIRQRRHEPHIIFDATVGKEAESVQLDRIYSEVDQQIERASILLRKDA